MQYFERLVQIFREVIQSNLSNSEIHYWLDVCISTIRELNGKIEKSDLSRGEKQKCQTCMTHLSCMQVELEQSLHQGGSIQVEDTTRKIKWMCNRLFRIELKRV